MFENNIIYLVECIKKIYKVLQKFISGEAIDLLILSDVAIQFMIFSI